MDSFIHKLHSLFLILVRYAVIFTVIFFLPVPLSHFLTDSVLSQTEHSPLFEYFTHYNISTDDVLENAYTSVYISENNADINQWDVDNAILWADVLAHRLQEENVPVIRKTIYQQKINKKSKKTNKTSNIQTDSLLPKQLKQTLIDVSKQFHDILPFISLTQDARQWIILALDSNPNLAKSQLKKLIKLSPQDNFLIVTRTPINLGNKSFRIDLPEFSMQQAKKILVEGLKVTQKQATILLRRNANSLLKIINENEDNEQLTIKSLLGENYKEFDDLNQKELNILQKICNEDKVKVGKNKLDLREFGAIIKNKHYQWESEESKLNYELQKEVFCGKEKLNIQQQNQSNGSIQENKENNQPTKLQPDGSQSIPPDSVTEKIEAQNNQKINQQL